MKHITITVTSELEDIEPYLRDILTTMKHHDEVTDFSVKTSTFTERPVKEHSNNKSISNHEAAEILKLMPKQSDAIKKAIEVLEERDELLDKIRAEIEPKCDRIHNLISVYPHAERRDIQEMLCEILDLCKAESEDKE